MASKNTEIKQDKMQERIEAFLEDWKTAMEGCNKRHEYTADDGSIMSFEMIPKLEADNNSIRAVYGIGHTRRENITVGKESEADGQPNSDDKVS
jgi:hypothetical protein